MDKIAVEIIELKIIKKRQPVLWIRIGRNGKVFRQGVGSLASMKVQVQAQYGHNIWFHSLIKDLPENLFAQPIVPRTISAESQVEYTLKFYGATDDIPRAGVHIDWNPHSTVVHPLQIFVDDVKEQMLSLTDTMYFDGVLLATLGYKSNLLPLETNVTGLESTAEKEHELEQYMQHLIRRQGLGGVKKLAAHKVFTLEDEFYLLQIQQASGTGALQFVPRNVFQVSDLQKNASTSKIAPRRKPWWLFWK